ncbi:hypothetical protein C8R46DRAFT_969648, partial [Mycena filopes]
MDSDSTLTSWDGFPNHRFRCQFTRQQVEDTSQLAFAVHWACEVRGGKKNSVGNARAVERSNGAHTLRMCLGVMKCTSTSGCKVVIRPQTKKAGRVAQLARGCSCGSTLQHHACDVRIEYWVYRDGAHFRHSGFHHHARVPARHLTPRELTQFANVVNEHPRMGPAQLLAGRPAVDGPGPSVADISSVLLNAHRIQYERRKILNPENKVRETASLRFLPKLERFKEKHSDWMVGVHWMDRVNVIVLQSPWQRRMGLKDQLRTEAVNGVISDACHNYFAGHNQLLFLSSTFEPLHLKSWVPILMTYSNGATSVHYHIHFLYLFRGMAQRCRETGVTVTDDLFANVVDFSDAQRNGYIDAFIDFWLEFSPHGRDEKELAQAAAALGCRQHFDNQITRVAKISRIVGPERQSVFRKYAKTLLRQTDMAGLRKCASAFIADFPGAKPWVNWWMCPSHASMLFPVASDMEQELWNSLPETTNAGECMHHRAYQMVGRDNSLFYGLAGLYVTIHYLEFHCLTARTHAEGVKVFYGSDPQYWKRTRFRYGYTKHSRHEARRKVSMDGRAPDTIARLKRNGLRKHPLRGLKPKAKMPEPTADRTFPEMQDIAAALPPKHILRDWLSIVEAHIEQAALSGFEQGGCKVLTRLRERFRKKLTTAKLAPSIGSSDAMFQALAKLIALKPHDGRAHFIALFRLYTVQVKKCAGCPAAPRAHWEVSHPLWRAPFQLSPEMHRLFGGDLSRWFRWMLDPSEWEKAACWRQSDANPFCNGGTLAKEYILNIPAILVLELGDTLRSSWKVPVTLLPLGQKFSAKGVKYTLVAQIYTNWTLKRGSSSHFIARYVTSDGAMIFDYDGMEHHGHAKHRLGAKTAGWMSGPSNKLKDLPSGYTLTALVYHLDGGLDAQQLFASER